MIVRIYRNTNFGNNELVWNVPHPDYDFSVHTRLSFENVEVRFPLLTTMIVLKGVYDGNTTFFDYMTIEEDDGSNKVYYFINSIVAERNLLLFSVTLDVITTYNMLSKAITGVIVRKHDTNPNETRWDYPSLLSFEGNYQNEYFEYVGYNNSENNVLRLIESAVDLTQIAPATTLISSEGGEISFPKLPKPSHNTDYGIRTWMGNVVKDESRALTLYLADNISDNVLNTLRGLSGDGAISDSYQIPTEGFNVSSSGSGVTYLEGRFQVVDVPLKLSALEGAEGWVPQNTAIRGMVQVSIMSLQEKTRITFPGWDLQESVSSNGDLRVNLWSDPKPSGAPYCCPDQVLSIHPNSESGIITLGTLEVKSVRGGQWLKNPLIYTTGKGELFASVETQLQRERSEYERNVALNDLEMAKRTRDVEIAQQDFNFQQSQVSNLMGGAGAILSGNIGGVVGAGMNYYNADINKGFLDEMRKLRDYEQDTQKTLIQMAHSNNLKNLNVQESIRRISPPELAFQSNESLGGYTRYNGFLVSLIIPDVASLKAKDMEYSKYGYPVYEPVTHFIMLDHLRQNHTVYQFESPLIEVGGKVGDMIRSVLESGIRILNKPYTSNNIINNPKVV